MGAAFADAIHGLEVSFGGVDEPLEIAEVLDESLEDRSGQAGHLAENAIAAREMLARGWVTEAEAEDRADAAGSMSSF